LQYSNGLNGRGAVPCEAALEPPGLQNYFLSTTVAALAMPVNASNGS